MLLSKAPSEEASVFKSPAGRYTLPEQGTATAKLPGEANAMPLLAGGTVKMMGSDRVEVEAGVEGCTTRRLGVVTVNAATCRVTMGEAPPLTTLMHPSSTPPPNSLPMLT